MSDSFRPTPSYRGTSGVVAQSKRGVCIVDDDPAVLKAVSRLLRSTGIDAVTFESGRRFLEECDLDRTCCVVLDIGMPEVSGLDLQRELAEKVGALPIIFLTGQGDVPQAVRAMKDGAADFLTKPADENDLLAAVRRAIARNEADRRAGAEVDEARRRLATLTPREREVFDHVVRGQLNKQIAADLGTVEKTVKVHRARVMEKMGVESLAELARLAERLGISPPPPAAA